MCKKIQKLILNLNRKHFRWYTACYIISFVLMLFAGTFFPYAAKSVVYPLIYDKQEVTGTIEEVRDETVKIRMWRLQQREY